MKTLLKLSVLFFLATFIAGNSEVYSNPNGDIKTIVIQCDGLSCENCDNKVEKNVSKLKGVIEVKANHRKLTVTVKYDEAIVSGDEIKAAITKLGYKVKND